MSSFPASPHELPLEIIPEASEGSSTRQTPTNEFEILQKEDNASQVGGDANGMSSGGSRLQVDAGILGDLMASLRNIGHFEQDTNANVIAKNEAVADLEHVERADQTASLYPCFSKQERTTLLPTSLSAENQGAFPPFLPHGAIPTDEDGHFRFQAPFLFRGGDQSQPSPQSSKPALKHTMCSTCGHWVPQDERYCGRCGQRQGSTTDSVSETAVKAKLKPENSQKEEDLVNAPQSNITNTAHMHTHARARIYTHTHTCTHAHTHTHVHTHRHTCTYTHTHTHTHKRTYTHTLAHTYTRTHIHTHTHTHTRTHAHTHTH